MKKNLVIIPTYNEAENIVELVKRVLSIKNLDLLIIEDNSPDGTYNVISKYINKYDGRLKIILRKGKLGLGSAYRDGFRYALDKKYDSIMTMDADFSHNPDDIPKLLNYSNKFDVSIGSRYTKGGIIKNWGFIRRLISKSANLLAKSVLNTGLEDNTTGFRCYNAKVVKKILQSNLKTNGYSFIVGIAYIMQKSKFSVKEIPIHFIDRKYGSSKISKKEIIQSAFLLAHLGIKRLFRREL